ncbi:uncharacterized protein BP5553_01651 [Venustampulla echinocandica]|uniref:Uncharacterized protein n=1 Tax=Venustampulla echinocandica TaxID=2656787 RepID=A0A370U1L5_9HELO|nr:uncharacterized protein BP5553_01651 [Venustampulla echinocandica]RDL41672.1 hypothetical protein BP5553_01651 [Venustampulla echinocandica]
MRDPETLVESERASNNPSRPSALPKKRTWRLRRAKPAAPNHPSSSSSWVVGPRSGQDASLASRKCDGYAPPQSRKKRQDSASGPTKVKPEPNPAASVRSEIMRLMSKDGVTTMLGQFPDCTPREKRSLDFFYEWSTAKMAGWHGREFWYGHVPRAGYSEPAVRHAMIALAITHEQMAVINDAIPNDPRMDKSVCLARKIFALQHYSKAVTRLAKIMAERGGAVQKLALINCLIFVIIDFLWGNVATAMVHVQSGADILERWRKKHGKEADVEGSLEAMLVTLFNGTNFGRFSAPTKKAMVDEPERDYFVDLAAARQSIEDITGDANALDREGAAHEDMPKDDLPTARNRAPAEDHRQRLEVWASKFEGLLSTLGPDLVPQQEEEIAAMRVLYFSGLVWIWACADPQPAQPLEVFGQLISVAEDLAKVCVRHGEDATYHIRKCIYDTRVCFSYSFIAKSCTDIGIKERAMALLAKIASGMEGKAVKLREGLVKVESREDNWKTWVKMTGVGS